MSIRDAYNSWATQYDTNLNKTRDLEAVALRQTLTALPFQDCLEIGCGTGKNTEWLATKADKVTAVDFSEEMLQKAKEKITANNVEFVQADITGEWNFVKHAYDLVTFSLVLEHIDDLDSIFKQTAKALNKGGHVYIGELHPFKQYTGSKARFETEQGIQVVECYNHHISDFTNAAKKHGFYMADLQEYFDEENQQEIPRILVLLFKKI